MNGSYYYIKGPDGLLGHHGADGSCGPTGTSRCHGTNGKPGKDSGILWVIILIL